MLFDVASDVVLVIVTYNSEHVVHGLLDSLPAALGGLRPATVVVDNGSTDSTAEIVGRRSDVHLVRSANVGYGAGINRGVAEIDSDSPILVLNPDVRMFPDSVGRLMEAASLDGVGIAVPKVLGADGSLHRSLRREPSIGRALGLTRTKVPFLSEYVDDSDAYERQHSVDWALGAVMLITRECHDALNGWDESYFLYSEETDFCLRARDLGYATRYTPSAVVEHIGGQSGQSGKTHAMQIVNRVRLYRRRHGPLPSTVYYALTVANEATRAVRPGGERSRASLTALIRPKRRPAELHAAERLIPN